MASSSSSPHITLEVEQEYSYPYPSHVYTPSFVTIKLSGKDKYNIWKTQILCLLESHGMLGFINGAFVSPQSSSSGKEKPDDHQSRHRLWRRSDALVKGWILGSLSEKTLTFVVDRLIERIRHQERNNGERIPEGTKLSDVRNSNGSTPLHVAAIIGNSEAAKILVGKYPELLLEKDKEGQTPLALAFSNMHNETARLLGDELLVTVISSKDFRLANDLLERYGKLDSDAVLMVIGLENSSIQHKKRITVGGGTLTLNYYKKPTLTH
ncbi:hypothetical protein LXL04_027901 [Taraxacum kok-saghyz]